MNQPGDRRKTPDPGTADGPDTRRPTDRRQDEGSLEDEGERAAGTGRSWQSNPYLRRENMPGATGEDVREWSRKHDAWQRGFEGGAAEGGGGAAKETLAEDLLAELLQQHILGMASVQLELKRNRWSSVRVSPPRGHARDAQGRNWDVVGFECGALDESACQADFRAVVDALRDRYDMQ